MKIKIEKLGAKGDGVAQMNGKLMHVPFALPGEEVDISTTPNAILHTSPQRAEAACEHFLNCGGCQMQHLQEPAYLDWKQKLISDALSSRDISVQVRPILTSQAGERRRAEFTSRITEQGLVFGYHAPASKYIFELTECTILHPQILECLPFLRQIATKIASKNEMRFAVLLADNGLDVSVSGPKKLSEELRQHIIKLTLRSELLRLSFGDEILIEKQAPVMNFGGIDVQVPPKSFTQATQNAQEAMVELITNELKGCKQVADLFCGSGTFTLPLAQQSKVAAYEYNEGAIKALDRAYRFGKGLKTLDIERRDLFRTPISAREMRKWHGLVFDPPRAGAETQVKEIAKSHVPRVVAVSCNPASFARDARILIDGGYELHWVQPVDQFLFSYHLELVALFTKTTK